MKLALRTLMIAILLLLFVRHDVMAQSQPERPREVGVGLYVLNFGALDINEGTFTADFYLTIKDSQPIQDDSFEFVNGTPRKINTTDDYKEADTYVKVYRITADLTTKVDLSKYPFDSQQLPIRLESKVESTEHMVFVPLDSKSGIDEGNSLPGWSLGALAVDVKEHYYPVFKEGYSQFRFAVTVSKNRFNAYFQTFSSVSFTILVCLLSFLLGPDKLHIRSKITNVALIASGMFFKKLVDRIPAVSYLTFLDKFMFLTYSVLIIYILVNVYVTYLQNQNNDGRIAAMQTYSVYVLAMLTLTLYMGLFWIYL
ncbi:hypothetical protein [Paenibacillus cremeus]|uniref:Neurotransmitter-gated ion-channel ligand-binding domain-containing protein n=1 Tax=Paenibacillus cremeus TaxID=2163881 RepID=A0A559JZU3_9BACL|nr:hypothetical protein [Paenibacillus cremeus]TVY05409.1 hypothetical protein FPZ49_30265 [Paenibacillus cremeus]